MTTELDIANRALLAAGLQKRINSFAQDSAEAQAFDSIFENVRDDLLRVAPWNFALNTTNLTYITSTPGTPENTSPVTTLWEKGQPPPPWAYEYQYPVDCLKACWMIPAAQTGYAGIPITTAVTGGVPSYWYGAPIKFKVQVDQFYPVTAASAVAVGTGYAIGDRITLASGAAGSVPIGAPVVLQVTDVTGSAIDSVAVVNQIAGSATPLGGSYFLPQTGTIAQGSTTGAGTGATFTLTFGPQGDQRIILTNQEFATLAYVKQVTDPNLMDTLFQSAWISILGAELAMVLTGDRDLANSLVKRANSDIEEARKPDGNEGLTNNNVTPDWIRGRGISFTEDFSGPYNQGYNFDWGPLWGTF